MNRGIMAKLSSFAILGFTAIAMPLAAFGQPTLTAFSFTPNSINTSSSPATVAVHFSATDSAGIAYFEMSFMDPSGVFIQRASEILVPSTSVTSSVNVTFPAFSNSGTWTVGGVFLLDIAGNTTFLDTTALSGMGFSTTLQVNSAVDNVPPTLTSLSLSAPSINTTSGPANLAVNFSATDDKSGVQAVQVSLTSPSGESMPSVTVNLTPALSVSGAANFTFPRLSEAGTWTISSVFLADAAGNTTFLNTAALSTFPTTFIVVSSKDTQAPSLTSFNYTPTSIDTKGGPAAVNVNFHVTDDLSGATTFQAGFLSPSGLATVTASSTFPASLSFNGAAGIVFPQGSETGTWTVAFIFLSDAAGNTTTLTTADLAGRFPTQLTVTNTGGAPVITPTVNPAPNSAGWNTTVPVTVSWNITDPSGAGIVSSTGCGTTVFNANTPGTTLTCSATSGSGLTGSASVTIKIDTTPPVIVPTVSPAPNGAGWNKSAATVTWSFTDPDSGIAFSTGCDSTTVSTETAGTTFTCSATNGAGLSTTKSVTVKLDETAPTISGMPAAGCTLWPPNQKLVQVAVVTAADTLSGLPAGSFQVTGVSNQPQNDPHSPDIVITPTGTGGYTVQLRADRTGSDSDRIYTLTGTATDTAGNTATVTATCTVPHDQGNGN